MFERLAAAVVYYPTLWWNVFQGRIIHRWQWWTVLEPTLILGAVPFRHHRNTDLTHRSTQSSPSDIATDVADGASWATKVMNDDFAFVITNCRDDGLGEASKLRMVKDEPLTVGLGFLGADR